MIEVSEVFPSVQGEGRLQFRPSVFLRLRRCNLQCSWCDTKYTWDETAEGYEEYVNWEPELLAAQVQSAKEAGVPQQFVSDLRAAFNEATAIVAGGEVNNLVITGGEPLIWKAQIREMLEVLPDFASIEFETNGTIAPFDADTNKAWNISYNVSPKLVGAGNVGLNPLREDILRQFFITGRAYWKFVVDPTGPFKAEIFQLENAIGYLKEWGANTENIYLMPQSQTYKELLDRQDVVEALAARLGVNYTSRAHVRVWGAERGV